MDPFDQRVGGQDLELVPHAGADRGIVSNADAEDVGRAREAVADALDETPLAQGREQGRGAVNGRSQSLGSRG